MGGTGARQVIRWVLRHKLFRQTVGRQAKAGDLTARLILDPELVDNPFPHLDTLRAQGRLVDSGLVLNAAHHDVVTAVLRSPDFGVAGGPVARQGLGVWQLAARAGGRGPLGPAEPPSMLTVDAPDHTRYRKLVNRAFTARAVAGLRTRTEEIATGLLDAMAAKGGEADLIDDYASLLPATVIAEMLGAPVAMRGQFLEWGAGAALSLDPGLSLRQFIRSERDVAALRGAGCSDTSSTSAATPATTSSRRWCTRTTDEGRLTEDELTSIAVLLLAAGFETTVNLIGNGAALLAAHPAQLDLLRAEPRALAPGGRRGAPLRLPGAAHRADRPVRHGGGGRAGPRGAGRPADARWGQPRSGRLLRPAPLRRHPRQRRRPRRLLQRHPLLPRCGPRADGG